jgi:hypothetical protein
MKKRSPRAESATMTALNLFQVPKPRHLARNCCAKLDVCTMTYDELIAAIQEDTKVKQKDFQSEDR